MDIGKAGPSDREPGRLVRGQPAVLDRIAGELALSLINDPEADRKQHVVLPTTLIPRAATAPPPRTPGEREGNDDRG